METKAVEGGNRMPVGVIGDSTPVGIIQSGNTLVELRAGEVVRALVRDVTHQEVVLMIRGHRVEAQTQVPLKAGETVNLQVVELGEGRMVFQLVPDQPAGTGGDVPARLTPEALLWRHHLPQSPGHVLLARALLANGIGDIGKESFLLLGRLLSGNPSPGEVQALVRLFAQGQGLQQSHAAALQALMQLFAGEAGEKAGFQGGQQASNISVLAESLAQRLGGGIPKEVPAQLLAELSITAGEEGAGAKLAALPGRLGLDYEARLLAGGLDRATVPQAGDPSRVEHLSLKEILLQVVQGETAGQGQPGEAMPALKHLLQVLTGLQLLHLGHTEAGHSYVMGWLHWPQRSESSPFFLSFFQDPSGGTGPGEPGRQVMIKTQTPRLGDILGDLRLYGHYLSVQLAVETKEAQKAFNQYMPDLAAMLEGLPWRVHILPCRLVGKEEKDDWWQKFVEPAVPQRLDVRL